MVKNNTRSTTLAERIQIVEYCVKNEKNALTAKEFNVSYGLLYTWNSFEETLSDASRSIDEIREATCVIASAARLQGNLHQFLANASFAHK